MGFKLMPSVEKEACDDDLQAERDEQDRKVREFNSKTFEDFYGDALKDIEKEMKKG